MKAFSFAIPTEKRLKVNYLMVLSRIPRRVIPITRSDTEFFNLNLLIQYPTKDRAIEIK